MDELAAAAGKNPYDFRLQHLGKKPRQRRVLQLAAERAGWGKPPAGRYQGIALMEGYTTHLAQVAEISIVRGELKVHKITCVVDCGQMVNPRIVESQIESGIVFGLSAALWGEVTLVGGKVQQTNFNNYRVLRNNELPELDVHLVESDETPGGIGEAAVPLVAPALCNAIFTATGKRLRELPIGRQKLVQVLSLTIGAGAMVTTHGLSHIALSVQDPERSLVVLSVGFRGCEGIASISRSSCAARSPETSCESTSGRSSWFGTTYSAAAQH